MCRRSSERARVCKGRCGLWFACVLPLRLLLLNVLRRREPRTGCFSRACLIFWAKLEGWQDGVLEVTSMLDDVAGSVSCKGCCPLDVLGMLLGMRGEKPGPVVVSYLT